MYIIMFKVTFQEVLVIETFVMNIQEGWKLLKYLRRKLLPPH